MLSGTSIVRKSSGQELTMALSTPHPSLETCVSSCSPVGLNSIEDLSTWLSQDSPVNHFQQSENNWGQMIPETCGRRRLTPYASYDHDMRYWKTFQPSLIADISDEYLATWPKWGWMQSGVCSVLAPLVRHTHGSACSSWPTPTASDATGGGSARQGEMAERGEKRKSGHNIVKRVKDIFKHRYGVQPPPRFYEWLMGIPIGATGLEPVAMDKCRSKSPSHGMYSALNCEVLMEWKEKNLATLSEFLSGLWR